MTYKIWRNIQLVINVYSLSLFEWDHALCCSQFGTHILMCTERFILTSHNLNCPCSHILLYMLWNQMMESHMVSMVMGIEYGVRSRGHVLYLTLSELFLLAARKIAAKIKENFGTSSSDFRNASAYLIGSAMNSDVHIISISLYVVLLYSMTISPSLIICSFNIDNTFSFSNKG